MYILFRSTALTWRCANCVQLGVDDPVLIAGMATAEASLLRLLKHGIPRPDFTRVARSLGMSEQRAHTLLELLRESRALMPEPQLEPHTLNTLPV